MKAFCPFCEKEYNNLEVQTRYEITTLNGVTAEWQKKYITCPDCGEELYNGELHDANLRVVYAACKVSDIDKPVEDLCDYVLKLKMENAELRARLECSIEFPCKVGDTIYYINPYKEQPKIDEFKVMSLCKDNSYGRMIYVDNGEFFFAKTDGLFFTRAEAEARLKELQEKEERK